MNLTFMVDTDRVDKLHHLTGVLLLENTRQGIKGARNSPTMKNIMI